MSGLDVMRSFAESREVGHRLIQGVTYRHAREVLAEVDALRERAWLAAWEAVGAVAARDLLLEYIDAAAQDAFSRGHYVAGVSSAAVTHALIRLAEIGDPDHG